MRTSVHLQSTFCEMSRIPIRLISSQREEYKSRPDRWLMEGSPLSPILHVTYLKNISENVPSEIHPRLYAGDVLLAIHVRHPGQWHAAAAAICIIEAWCFKQRMQLNAAKTRAIIFRRNPYSLTLPLDVFGENICGICSSHIARRSHRNG